MNDFNSWSDINWYALGNLLTQLAFLVAGLWFARNFLRTVRAFQEQVGALLKLSITAAPSGRMSASVNTKGSLVEGSPYWLAPSETQSETQTAREPQFIESCPGPLVRAWRGLVHWLNEPMHTSQVSAWRRLANWLHAPVAG
jgi:hypothetical protein